MLFINLRLCDTSIEDENIEKLYYLFFDNNLGHGAYFPDDP